MRVRNLLALSKTQVILVDTDPLHWQPKTVAARDRSTRSPGANRRPSRCEVFRLPHLVRLVRRGAALALPGALEMLSSLPVALDLSRFECRSPFAFRPQPFVH